MEPIVADVELVEVDGRVLVVEAFALFDPDPYVAERARDVDAFDVWNIGDHRGG